MKQILPHFLFLSTIQWISAQCATPEMTIWQNTWQSCQTSTNPNANRPSGHWIQYDLGSERVISKVHVWNVNDPTQLENGFRSVTVDYSNDGINWVPLGTYDFPQGTGEPIYSGFEGFDLQGQKTRYILLTANSNWGGSCYGIAEIKFNLMLDLNEENNPDIEDEEEEEEDEVENDDDDEMVDEDDENPEDSAEDNDREAPLPEEPRMVIFPNPARSQANVVFESPNEVRARLQVFNILGQLLYSNPVQAFPGENQYTLPTNRFSSGIYLVRLQTNGDNDGMVKKLIVNK
ncbi:MAG: T9SS type A sorting domain-containing protein [Bacteroidota bacterium]